MTNSASQGKDTTQALVAQAITAKGDEYLQSERALLQRADAIAELQKRTQDADPVARFVVKTLLDWIEGRAPDNDAALQYLDAAEKRYARTPVGNPPPTGVARYLVEHYAGRVTPVLTLRLIKAESWPHWRVMTVLFYAQQHPDKELLAPLTHFAATTNEPEWRNEAVETVNVIRGVKRAQSLEP
jgi:hypothetical protein